MSNRAEQRRKQRQAARVRGSGGGSGNTIYWILGGAGLIGVLVVGWNVVSSLLDDTVREPVEVVYDSPQELLALAQGVERGDPGAPLRIMEFSDYQCPACRSFYGSAKPMLDREYVDEGRALFVYYDFPLVGTHPNAFLAARAARCAGDQQGYWPFHNRLFDTQHEWSGLSDPAGRFERIAEEVGLDPAGFRSCLRSDRHAEVVTANMILGEELGVQATPTIIVDTGEGRPIRVANWNQLDDFRRLLDGALEDAEDGAGGGR